MAAAEGPAAPDGAPPERLRTERLLGVLVADATAGAVAARMVAWSPRPPARTVVGLDLTVADALRHDPLLRRAFREADAVVPASLGVLLLARREGAPLAGRVAASDLVTAVAAASARAGRSLFLVGSIMEDLHHLARRLSANHAGLEIRGAYAVPRGFERDPAAHGELLGIIRTVRPHVILVALEPSAGAVWAEGMAGAVPRGVFVTLGAGVVPDWDRAQRTGTIGSAAFGKDIGGMLRNGLRNLPHALAMTPRVPALWREHRKDRESYHALERRRALARLSDERYCQWRASLREDAEPSSGSDGDHGTS